MKEFNLEAALNGEPVNANGQKCYVVREVTELLDDKSLRRFVVIFPDSFTDAEIWDEHDLIDDIEMWEDPKISVEDLPKPFIPKKKQEYWVISPDYDKPLKFHAMDLNHSSILNSNCFRTEADAQKWIDFMKSMME